MKKYVQIAIQCDFSFALVPSTVFPCHTLYQEKQSIDVGLGPLPVLGKDWGQVVILYPKLHLMSSLYKRNKI